MNGSGDRVLEVLAANLIAVEGESQCPAVDDSMRPGCDRFCRPRGVVPLEQRRWERATPTIGVLTGVVYRRSSSGHLLTSESHFQRQRQHSGHATFPVAPITQTAGSNREP